MWWNKEVFGQELYNVILWFLLYSMLGWLVESIYMSICNRKLTNRGFAKGPFCPIYGIGALTVYFALNSYTSNKVLLFVLGAILATVVEFVTALFMQKIFGEVWWDYHEKPFNFKGIICLESSIAWGVYTLIFFTFLQGFVNRVVDSVPIQIGKMVGFVLIFVLVGDSLVVFYKEKREDVQPKLIEWKERFKERFMGN